MFERKSDRGDLVKKRQGAAKADRTDDRNWPIESLRRSFRRGGIAVPTMNRGAAVERCFRGESADAL